MSRLMRWVAMAVVAMAAIAPSALAQASGTEPLTLSPGDLHVNQEVTGVICPAVTPNPPPATGPFTTAGGCLVHVTGYSIQLGVHLFGIESVDTCSIEFDMRIAANATGYLSHQEMVPSITGTCGRRPCHYPNTPNPSFEPPASNQNEPRPWRFYAREYPSVPSTEAITILLCTEPRHTQALEPPGSYFTAKRHCQVTFPFTETADHRYTFTANDVVGSTGADGVRCELTGTFNTEVATVPGGEGSRLPLEINHF